MSHPGRETGLGAAFSKRRQGSIFCTFYVGVHGDPFCTSTYLLHHRFDPNPTPPNSFKPGIFSPPRPPKRAMDQESQTSEREKERGKRKKQKQKRDEWRIL